MNNESESTVAAIEAPVAALPVGEVKEQRAPLSETESYEKLARDVTVTQNVRSAVLSQVVTEAPEQAKPIHDALHTLRSGSPTLDEAMISILEKNVQAILSYSDEALKATDDEKKAVRTVLAEVIANVRFITQGMKERIDTGTWKEEALLNRKLQEICGALGNIFKSKHLHKQLVDALDSLASKAEGKVRIPLPPSRRF